ncbi:hypothetical protein KQX54_018264 [Cotesia glomerata]|uniref:Uncharacterized protein n=1 Tax=Cotesia glomerata TaxID=32391 RepID=A0AAV7HYF2_COTGL|nr:hypothetical protein KQX54_018264 [Cotesia glomerata]
MPRNTLRSPSIPKQKRRVCVWKRIERTYVKREDELAPEGRGVGQRLVAMTTSNPCDPSEPLQSSLVERVAQGGADQVRLVSVNVTRRGQGRRFLAAPRWLT